MRLKAQTKSIDELISSIDDNNSELRGEILECYDEMEEIAEERKQKMYPIVPGAEIARALEEWDERNDSTVCSDHDLRKFTSELWVSLQQYEQ